MDSIQPKDKKHLPANCGLQIYLDNRSGYPITLAADEKQPSMLRISISHYLEGNVIGDSASWSPVYLKNLTQPPHQPVVQDKHGVAFSESDILAFSMEVQDLKKVVLLVSLFDGTSLNGQPELFAQGFLAATTFTKSAGFKDVLLFRPTERSYLGHLKVEYLVIKPRPLSVGQSEEKITPHQIEKSLNIGHRGSGATFSDSSQSNSPFTENTLRSFTAAAEKQADFVEFDVSLTKDLVPVIYHDFHVGVKTFTHDASPAILSLPICQLSQQELRKTVTIPESSLEKSLTRLSRTALDVDESLFPSLQEALEKVPSHLGFLIELKYPQMLIDGTHECEPRIDENVFVDRILDVVLQYAKTRKIMFCSFDPRTVILLRAKQCDYPVYFITCGNNDKYTFYEDMRTRTIENAVAFAVSENLQGISAFVDPLEATVKETLDLVQSAGLKLLTWGTKNNEANLAASQRQIGVHGVTHDRIH